VHLYSAITQDTSNTFSGGSDDNAPQVEGGVKVDNGPSRQLLATPLVVVDNTVVEFEDYNRGIRS